MCCEHATRRPGRPTRAQIEAFTEERRLLEEKLRALYLERMEEQMRQPEVRAWFLQQMGEEWAWVRQGATPGMVIDQPTEVEAPVAKELVLA